MEGGQKREREALVGMTQLIFPDQPLINPDLGLRYIFCCLRRYFETQDTARSVFLDSLGKSDSLVWSGFPWLERSSSPPLDGTCALRVCMVLQSPSLPPWHPSTTAELVSPYLGAISPLYSGGK